MQLIMLKVQNLVAQVTKHLGFVLPWLQTVAYPGIFFGGGSTNSVEDRGQRGRGSGGW